MHGLVVAFEKDDSRRRICDMLDVGGFQIYAACKSGAEVIRSLNKTDGGIVISGYKLSDMTASDLSYNLPSSSLMLLVAQPEQLDCCDNEDMFKLPFPVSKGDLLASVRILVQIIEKQMRFSHRRTDEDEKLILKAKELLMSRNLMTEAQAHRFIQRRSMETGLKMAETARLIIESY